MGDVKHLTVPQKKNDALENKRVWEKTADKYIKNCHKFEIKIDSSVVIALQTGCDFLSVQNETRPTFTSLNIDEL